MSQFFSYKDKKINVGDTVQIHQEITEGEKKRIQLFEGLVIAVHNAGTGKSITVRKIGAAGVGVEKILPVNMPMIKDIVVKRRGEVRRSKLYYLRAKVGKAASRVKEKSLVGKAKTASK